MLSYFFYYYGIVPGIPYLYFSSSVNLVSFPFHLTQGEILPCLRDYDFLWWWVYCCSCCSNPDYSQL